ncbi:hypothetical protein [Streptomyces toxytricini]|uniref:hypothetical protein n=1 Tax=Streptomyces toxytricini TaxID=67369 RepID=UPI00341756A1
MNKIRRAFTLAAAAASVVVLTSTPASAYPNWQPWGADGFYYCGPTTHSGPSTKVIHQTCIRENYAGQAQAVLLVRNNATVDITLNEGSVWWYTGKEGSILSRDDCTQTVVRPGQLKACYGGTYSAQQGQMAISGYLYNNDYNVTEPVYKR